MRKTFFKGLDDALEYDFGSDVDIICAGAELARRIGPVKEDADAISTACILTGRQLIDFILGSAPAHADVIPKILKENHYKLVVWDW